MRRDLTPSRRSPPVARKHAPVTQPTDVTPAAGEAGEPGSIGCQSGGEDAPALAPHSACRPGFGLPKTGPSNHRSRGSSFGATARRSEAAALAQSCSPSGYWIPAFAGMTAVEWSERLPSHTRLTALAVSVPDPLHPPAQPLPASSRTARQRRAGTGEPRACPKRSRPSPRTFVAPRSRIVGLRPRPGRRGERQTPGEAGAHGGTAGRRPPSQVGRGRSDTPVAPHRHRRKQ